MQKKHEVEFSKTTHKNPEETKSVQNIPQENKIKETNNSYHCTEGKK